MTTSFEEFELSDSTSTYEPIGDIFNDGKKVKGAGFIAHFCGHFIWKNNDITKNLIWAQLCNNGHHKQLPGQPSPAGPPHGISCLNKTEIEIRVIQHLRQNISDKM